MEVNKPWNSDGGSKLFINAERREKTHRYCVSPIFVARHDCKPFKSSACRKCCDRARSLGISRHGASPPPHTEESTAWCDTNTLHHRTVCSQVSASLYPFKFRINVRSVYFMFSKVSRMTQVLLLRVMLKTKQERARTSGCSPYSTFGHHVPFDYTTGSTHVRYQLSQPDIRVKRVIP
jgi:hypothetical protein